MCYHLLRLVIGDFLWVPACIITLCLLLVLRKSRKSSKDKLHLDIIGHKKASSTTRVSSSKEAHNNNKDTQSNVKNKIGYIEDLIRGNTALVGSQDKWEIKHKTVGRNSPISKQDSAEDSGVFVQSRRDISGCLKKRFGITGRNVHVRFSFAEDLSEIMATETDEMKVRATTDVNANDVKEGEADSVVLTSTPNPKRAKAAAKRDSIEEEELGNVSGISSGSDIDSQDTFVKNDTVLTLNIPQSSDNVVELKKQLEAEQKLRKRAEDWSNFLERELDAHIDARKDSDEKYFKIRRKLKVYRYNYDKLKAKISTAEDVKDYSISRQASLVCKQDSIDLSGPQELEVELTEKFEKLLESQKKETEVVKVSKIEKRTTEKVKVVTNTQREQDTAKKSEDTAKKGEDTVDIVPVESTNVKSSVAATEGMKERVKPIGQGQDIAKIVEKRMSPEREEQLLADVHLTDEEEEHKKEAVQKTAEEQFLETSARRKSSAIDFEDVSNAKSFWEKKYTAKPKASKEPTATAIVLEVSEGSSENRKQFFEEMAAYNTHTQTTSGTKVNIETHLNDKKDAWEQKLSKKNEVMHGSGADLSKEALGHIQKTKLLWEEKMVTGSASSGSSRRRSVDSDEGINLSESMGNLQNKKQMWEEITTSGTCSTALSRRRSVESEEEVANLSTSLDLSNRSNLDLSEDSLSKIQHTKQMWSTAAEKSDINLVKSTDGEDDSGHEKENEDICGDIRSKVSNFEESIANQRRCVSEERISSSQGDDDYDDDAPAPLVRVGSIKLKKQLWENTARGISPDKDEVFEEKEEQDKPSQFIRAGSLRQKKQMWEKNASERKSGAAAKTATLEDEAKKNVCQNKAKWKEMENGGSSDDKTYISSDKTEDRLMADMEDAIFAHVNVESLDVKVESISNVAGTKSKWEKTITNQKDEKSTKKSKRSSLARLTPEDFKMKFSKWEGKDDVDNDSHNTQKKDMQPKKVVKTDTNLSSSSSSSDERESEDQESERKSSSIESSDNEKPIKSVDLAAREALKSAKESPDAAEETTDQLDDDIKDAKEEKVQISSSEDDDIAREMNIVEGEHEVEVIAGNEEVHCVVEKTEDMSLKTDKVNSRELPEEKCQDIQENPEDRLIGGDKVPDEKEVEAVEDSKDMKASKEKIGETVEVEVVNAQTQNDKKQIDEKQNDERKISEQAEKHSDELVTEEKHLDELVKDVKQNDKPLKDEEQNAEQIQDEVREDDGSDSEYESFDEDEGKEELSEGKEMDCAKMEKKVSGEEPAESGNEKKLESASNSSKRHAMVLDDFDPNFGSKTSRDTSSSSSSSSSSGKSSEIDTDDDEDISSSINHSHSALEPQSSNTSMEEYADALDESSLFLARQGSISLAEAEDDLDDLGSSSSSSSSSSSESDVDDDEPKLFECDQYGKPI